jgi:hypothetical protein
MGKLGLAAVTLALAAGNTAAAVDPDLLNLVMPDAKVLAGVRVDQSEASPFGKFLLAQVPDDPAAFQMFIAATGFDPRRDLREVLVAGDGEATSASRGLLLARGTFQPAQVLTTATALGATVSTYHGLDVLTSAAQGSPFSTAFLDASTAVTGNPDAVKAAIDRHFAGAVFSGPLAVQATDAGATNQVWFATTVPLTSLLGSIGNLSGMSAQNLLKTVSSVFGGVKFGSDTVTITLATATETDKDAEALAEVMRFLGNMMAQTAGAVVEQAGAMVHMTISLSEQQAEQSFTSRLPRPKKIAGAAR